MNKNFIEEPKFESVENSIEKEQLDAENQTGSIYGKFKDAKTLLEAYNALQSEFTRKSQKLAEFQRKEEESALFHKTEENVETILKGLDDSDKYKKEIEEIMTTNQEVGNLPNKYRIAFEMVKEAENKLANSLNSQEFFDKYIAKNEQIKTKIIEEYLSKLNNLKAVPKIVSGAPKSVHFSPSDAPKTFKEAGEIFSKMLN